MNRSQLSGHLCALITVLIWGSTLVSTKTLLQSFIPIEILFFRFSIAFLSLLIISPRPLRTGSWRQELYLVAAGLSGVTLYFLTENIALTYTYASNVGVIIASSPFFIAILAHFLLEGERLRPRFFLGFASAIAGISLISFGGSAVVQSNPKGDLIACIAPVMWAIYSMLMRKVSTFGYPNIACTRRVFFYGLLFMVPALYLFGFNPDPADIVQPVNLGNLLFLGCGASALCFVTWNRALSIIGPVKTSVYIYSVPAITLVCSYIVLGEAITWVSLLGTALILTGLVISQGRNRGA